MLHPQVSLNKFSRKIKNYVRVRIRGLEMLVFWKILRTYLMDDPKWSEILDIRTL